MVVFCELMRTGTWLGPAGVKRKGERCTSARGRNFLEMQMKNKERPQAPPRLEAWMAGELVKGGRVRSEFTGCPLATYSGSSMGLHST